MSSSSSSPDPQWVYDVFINFRGDDTRSTFISHLYVALSNAGINAFIDQGLHKGIGLASELPRAIEGSQIALVVFSENYTESGWCLRELEQIMECHRTYGQLVVPIFYDVDPSVVRNQTGAFGSALETVAEKRYCDGKVESSLPRWKRALTEAANLIGWDIRNCWNEAEQVQEVAYVTEILNGCGLHADIGIAVLIERSLLKVEKRNKLGMHNLLRDMGREIVHGSSEKEPGKRSRLWFLEDVLDVLIKNTGTKSIEGLALKLNGTNSDSFKANAFKEMKILRLLQLHHVQLSGDYAFLSKLLRWVYWLGFPLEYIPDNFNLERVVVIDIRCSNLRRFWKKPQLLKELKILNLSHSKNLMETPDFSKLPNLEKLILKDCPNLRKVHQSIGGLSNLLLINLKDCTNLGNIPRITYKLKSVKTLILSGCLKIDKLEEDIVQMESLTTLIADNTAVKQVPFSLVRSKSIGYISLCGYEGLSRNVFPSIIWSWLSPTTNPLSHIHPFWGISSSLASIHMQNSLGDLAPMLSSFSKLRCVLVQCDTNFQLSKELRTILDNVDGVNSIGLEIASYTSQISNHFLRSYLIRIGCHQEVFNTLSNSILEGLTTNESCDVSLPGDNYPCWLTYSSEGHSVPFVVPPDRLCHMNGMTLCVVYSSPPQNTAAEYLIGVLIINHTKCTIQIYKRDTAISFNEEDWQGIISHLESGDKVEFFVIFRHGLAVKKTVVYLLYNGFDALVDVEPKENFILSFIKRIVKKIVKYKCWQLIYVGALQTGSYMLLGSHLLLCP
ncbi:hypothetical protein VNO77_09355 [Canavalia gladiata]|uniref:TIR domain-containing protein n=1 Tax=Canavalia gladiata TaxID=3824 RepID=A0AAN9M9X1_CANGL